MSEGSRHFEEDSAVFKALHAIAQRLKELGTPYAIVGGMALFRHGLRRFTEDVDVLVTKESLKKIHQHLEGLGYLPPFQNSKHLRDTAHGVRIEFLTTGDYPGDGRKKPVSFPDPEAVSFEAEGIRYVNLPTLVELKLASGMTAPGRLKDLSDVLELIKALDLPISFADQLNPFVWDRFKQLWQEARKRFVGRRRKQDLAESDFEQMGAEGLALEPDGEDLLLTTTDPDIAQKYGLVDEAEFWGTTGEGEGNETRSPHS